MPGTGGRGGGGCTTGHPDETGGKATGAGKDMGGLTGAGTKSGWMPFGAGSTPVVGPGP